MSGVRVKSAELAALGVTLPGFVRRGKVIASLPSLGLLSSARAGVYDIESRRVNSRPTIAAEDIKVNASVDGIVMFRQSLRPFRRSRLFQAVRRVICVSPSGKSAHALAFRLAEKRRPHAECGTDELVHATQFHQANGRRRGNGRVCR